MELIKHLSQFFYILLALCCIGCNGNKAKDVSENDTISTKASIDTILTKDTILSNIPKLPSPDDSLNIIHKVKLENGDIRIFYHIYNDLRHLLYTKNLNNNEIPPKRIMTPCVIDDEDIHAEGLLGPFLYTTSPKGNNLFVVTCNHFNSVGWTCEHTLFKIDCISLKVELITYCAAVEFSSNGFSVAQARVKDDDERKCNAEREWLIHDELYDFNGKLTSESSKEYSEEKMWKKYSSSSDKYLYVKNFKEISYHE